MDKQKKDCKDPNCSQCISYSKIKKPPPAYLSSYNPYTLGLILRMIDRKCSDLEYLDMERVKWSLPLYVYVQSVQLMDDNPIHKMGQFRPGSDKEKRKFEVFHATNFASLASNTLQKAFIKDIDKVIRRLQKEHKTHIQKISVVLQSNLNTMLNKYAQKYLDPKSIEEIIKIQNQM